MNAENKATSVVESDVEIATPDGHCDAALFHPPTGTCPAVLIWPDAAGLRPSFRDMGRRLADAGYCVLVPNVFYRSAKAPVFDASFSFQNPQHMARLKEIQAPLNAVGAVERDASAYFSFLDSQPRVNRKRLAGTHGYCMGGKFALRTAALLPGRIGAAASFHGGGLVTDQPDSPHLLATRIEARMYFAIAANDDEKQPEAKDILRRSFSAANVPVEVELYAAQHGFCVPDMPPKDGQPIYSPADAERAWAKLLHLYRTVLG